MPPAPPWPSGARTASPARPRATPATPLHPRRARTASAAGLLAALAACLLAAGCATRNPSPVNAGELAEAQTFPYFRVYWAGPRFGSYPLTATNGRKNYNVLGDSLFYGNCLSGKSSSIGESGCALPLQVTTALYHRGTQARLGPHINALLRGVPAAIYDQGRSIELYTGRLTINVFSDSHPEALRAVRRLRPINAPGSARRPLPAPVYCPVLSGPQPLPLQQAMQHLPHHACQRAAAAERRNLALFGKS